MTAESLAPVVSLGPALERAAALEAAIAFRRAASGVRRANALGRTRADNAAAARSEMYRTGSDDAVTMRPACDETGDPRGEIHAPATSDGVLRRAAEHTATMDDAVQALLRLNRRDLVDLLADEHLTATRLQNAMRRNQPTAKTLRQRLVTIRTNVQTALENL